MPLTQARIGVLMGGGSAERPVSLKTGKAIYEVLRGKKYNVVQIDVDPSLPWQLRSKRVEMAFLALHGPGDEDGNVQGLLEVLRIPYTGSGVLASALAMDKPMTKRLLKTHGVPVPEGRILSRTKKPPTPPSDSCFPFVVKPVAQGSTIGVSIVRRRSEWAAALRRAFRQGDEIFVETYVPGRELAMSVVDGELLPPVEILAPGGFYDYAAKYEKDETSYQCPPQLSGSTITRLRDLAVRSYAGVGCEGAARVDFRLSPQGRPFFLEINTIPGMTQRSLLPMAALQAGMDYGALTEKILQSALRRGRAKRKGTTFRRM